VEKFGSSFTKGGFTLLPSMLIVSRNGGEKFLEKWGLKTLKRLRGMTGGG